MMKLIHLKNNKYNMATKGEFNENTRVQVPAAIHLCKLGYKYLSAISDDDLDP